LKPGSHRLDILIAGPELLAELVGGKPLMVARRVTVLLVVEELLQRGFLGITPLQNEEDARHRKIGRGRTLVKLRLRQRVRISAKGDQGTVVHAIHDAGLRGSGLRPGREWNKK
jgi:hypothetical protein